MRLIDAKSLKRKIMDCTFLLDWIKVLIDRTIDDQPTVDAKPVIYAYWDENCCCSNCHGDAPSDDTGNIILTEYCPSCGATMDEEDANNG